MVALLVFEFKEMPVLAWLGPESIHRLDLVKLSHQKSRLESSQPGPNAHLCDGSVPTLYPRSFPSQQAKTSCKNSKMWARLLYSHSFSVWFGCLLDYSRRYHSKASILRYGLDVLKLLDRMKCIPLPDETSYRILMHLCCLYNKPVLAMKVFQFLRDSGTQFSAVTYGLYNKALLECAWPSTDRDG